MDDVENMNANGLKNIDSSVCVKKPKKRSLVERELETNLTTRITSPITNSETTSLSRYGRARRLISETDSAVLKKVEPPKSLSVKSPSQTNSPAYKMHASNSPVKESSKEDNVYLNVCQENACLSKFTSDINTSSPLKKLPKVYVHKDTIEQKDAEETERLIKNIFSPEKSAKSNTHLNNILEGSERFNVNSSLNQNGFSIENSSVVKTLDFDFKKKRKENKDANLSKNELFNIEAKCLFQVGDIAWARMGTYPFWPCIVTRDPNSRMFVKKKCKLCSYYIHTLI